MFISVLHIRVFMGSKENFVGGYDLIEKAVNERSWANIRELSKYLHKLEPRSSAEAWRTRTYRWAKTQNATLKELLKKEDYDNISPVDRHTTMYYDEKNDVYLTANLDNTGIVKIDGEMHRQMKKSYSDDGEGDTIEQMSRKFKLPTSFLSNYVKMCGWTHGMDIYTDEEIQSRTIDDLVEESVNIKRNKILEKSAKKYWASIEKDADSYRLLQETWGNEFKSLIGQKATKVKPYKIEKSDAPYAVVMSPTDLHYGKHGWKDEVGEEYSLEIARERLLSSTANLISRFAGRPEKIIVATGSDWFHIDNEDGSTTKGTPQDMAGSPAQILMQGCKLAREHIDMLRAVCPVEVVFMRGNHDRHSALALMMYLDAVYEDTDEVQVICDPKTRQYLNYGNNLLGFTHGDGVKGNDLPALMATEQRQAWGDLENHTWFHGHLHHMKTTEMNGALIMQLPSLAGHDRYHYKKGYTMNKAGMSAHIIDKEQGVIGHLFCPVVRHG